MKIDDIFQSKEKIKYWQTLEIPPEIQDKNANYNRVDFQRIHRERGADCTYAMIGNIQDFYF